MSAITKVELGCGHHKRDGFYGIDKFQSPAVDLVLDIEREKLPFADDSIEHIYSSHCFEHLEADGSPMPTLREMIRVAKHGALIEIWTPHGKSNDGLLLGHRNFYTETHWQHIVYLYDDFYLGPTQGRFVWERTQYVLWPGLLAQLHQMNVPVEFAIAHWFNVAFEMGVFLRVDKHATRAQNPQTPAVEFCYRRGEVLDTRPPPAPLRHRLVDELNERIKAVPLAHAVGKNLGTLAQSALATLRRQ